MRKDLKKVVLGSLVILGMLFAASVSHAAIPNMKGTWKGTFNGVGFENVLQEGQNPGYAKISVKIKITSQNGRVFAGRIQDVEHEVKITGVIEANNNVTIQMYEYHTRGFFTAKLSVNNGVMTLNGVGNLYTEISLSSDPEMQTGQITLKKE